MRYVLFHKPRGVLTAKRRDPGNPALPTVTELLAESGLPSADGVSPVGRLDAESEGLLLLTDDGQLTQKMIHPSYACTKSYLAVVRGYGRPSSRLRCSRDMCESCVADGVLLRPASSAPYRAQPVEMALVSYEEAEAALGGGGALQRCLCNLLPGRDAEPAAAASHLEGTAAAADEAELDFVRVVLTEGKKHEVRLLLRSGGFATLRLVRLAHGPLHDPQLLARPPGAWRELSGDETERLLHAAAAWSADPDAAGEGMHDTRKRDRSPEGVAAPCCQ
eukprot:3114556-Prymnesium_polylepis.1